MQKGKRRRTKSQSRTPRKSSSRTRKSPDQRSAAALVERMKQMADSTQAEHMRTSLKTQLPLLGVTVVQVKEVAKEFLATQNSQVSLPSLLSTAQELWQTGYLEARLLGLLLLRRFEKHFDEHIWQLADRWLDEIDDWWLCDTLCVCLTAPMIAADLSNVEKLMPWTDAESLWRRRAAVVSLRQLHRQDQPHSEVVLQVCQQLMQDTEWPVRKAVGFTLRDVGLHAPEQLADFLKKWKLKTHRSVIREATKKLPPKLRQAVLSG